jgi:hypothetical protein
LLYPTISELDGGTLDLCAGAQNQISYYDNIRVSNYYTVAYTVTTDGSTPLEGASVLVYSSVDGEESETALTEADGKVEYSRDGAREYLCIDGAGGTAIIYKTGYATQTAAITADVASTITMAAGGSVAIASPAISDTTITTDQGVTVTATITASSTAFVVFKSPGTSTIVHVEKMTASGTAYTCYIRSNALPVGVYGAGDIEIIATDSTYVAIASDQTLTCTVTAGTSLPTGFVARWFKQTVTIEPYAGLTDTVEYTYGTGVEYAARTEKRETAIRSATGEVVISHCIVYISGASTVTPKDRITLPDGTKPPILQVDDVRNVDGSARMKVVYV